MDAVMLGKTPLLKDTLYQVQMTQKSLLCVIWCINLDSLVFSVGVPLNLS